MSLPTAAVAPLSLLAGFGVAQLSGVRALGGLVLVLAVAWCAVRWTRRSRLVAVALVGLYLAAFVGSHLLARVIGAWPSVLLVAAVVGAAVVALDRDRASSSALAGPSRT